MIHITFTDGSNPYILTNENYLYKWFNIYTITPCRYKNGILYVTADERAKKTSYSERKEAARLFAIDVQNIISESNFSYGEIADISDTLHALGRHFGLVREFKENCIC